MKKGQKKFLAILCSVGLCLAMAGCGSNGEATQSSESAASQTKTQESTQAAESTESTQSSESASGETVTLDVWCWSPNEDLLQTGVDMYNELGHNVELNVTILALADVRTRITTIANSGDYSQLPDIILMQDTSIPMLVRSYPDVFHSLADSGINTDDYDQSKIAWCSYNGELYAVPFDSGVGVACYRTDYLEQAGYTIDDLWDITWSEFQAIGEDVLEQTGHPLLSTASDATLLTMMLNSTGESYFDEEGNVNLNNNETLFTIFERFRDMANSGTIQVVTNWDEYMSSLNAGSSAGTINGMWILNSVKQAPDQAGNWGIANLPSVDGIEGAANYAASGGSSWMITSNCSDYETALDLLTTVMGGELSDAFYQDILLDSNYIAGYLPTAGNEEIYNTPDDFFNGDTIYATLGQFVDQLPASNTSSAYDETINAVATALTNVLNGADIQSELDNAQSTVDFAMGN